jgi:protein-S-isoprenylcysteine O-methyltransferase Ste14
MTGTVWNLENSIGAGIVWATPHMTMGHLLFAIGTTAYIVIGVHFEEHDLKAYLGEDYATYQGEVPMLCPFRIGRPRNAAKE